MPQIRINNEVKDLLDKFRIEKFGEESHISYSDLVKNMFDRRQEVKDLLEQIQYENNKVLIMTQKRIRLEENMKRLNYE